MANGNNGGINSINSTNLEWDDPPGSFGIANPNYNGPFHHEDSTRRIFCLGRRSRNPRNSQNTNGNEDSTGAPVPTNGNSRRIFRIFRRNNDNVNFQNPDENTSQNISNSGNDSTVIPINGNPSILRIKRNNDNVNNSQNPQIPSGNNDVENDLNNNHHQNGNNSTRIPELGNNFVNAIRSHNHSRVILHQGRSGGRRRISITEFPCRPEFPRRSENQGIPSQNKGTRVPLQIAYFGVLVGLGSTITGIFLATMCSNFTTCFSAGVIQAVLGILTLILEVLCLQDNLSWNRRHFYAKSVLYIILWIIPLGICPSWETGVGAGGTLLGIIYLIYTVLSKD